MRTRMCLNGLIGNDGCIGSTMETRSCHTEVCPEFSLWSDWSECSVVCGGGRRSRSRTCLNGAFGDDGCKGDTTETDICNLFVSFTIVLLTLTSIKILYLQSCPTWSAWVAWSDCSAECGLGERRRSRSCVSLLTDEVALISCVGDSFHTESCIRGECPDWAQWGTWSSCSDRCGEEGTQTRRRVCVNSQIGDEGCDGSSFDLQQCNRTVREKIGLEQVLLNNYIYIQPCPYWSEWGEYTECSVTCGGGVQSHRRFCIGGEVGDLGCVGPTEEQSFCNGNVNKYRKYILSTHTITLFDVLI